MHVHIPFPFRGLADPYIHGLHNFVLEKRAAVSAWFFNRYWWTIENVDRNNFSRTGYSGNAWTRYVTKQYEAISRSMTYPLKLFIFCFCFSAILTKEISVAIATFNSKGVTGTIKFTDNLTSITITGTLYNLPNSSSLLIRMFPIDLTISSKERCTAFFLETFMTLFPWLWNLVVVQLHKICAV